MSAPDVGALVDAAAAARTHARCPYSRFAVGCAALDDRGHLYRGANVENASYTLGLCAERVTLFHAVTSGAGAIQAVAIVTGADEPTYPCGACRQILWELAPKATLVLATTGGAQTHTTVAALLPHPFDDHDLGAG